MDNSEFEKKLNHILERNYDAQQGFDHVAEHIVHDEFRTIMDKSIAMRFKFVDDIKAIMTNLGMKPKIGSSVEGEMHRAWMNFREIFSTNNDAAMLDEAIRGESHAEEAYADVLADSNLQSGHADILRNHLASIHQTIIKLKTLKRSAEASA